MSWTLSRARVVDDPSSELSPRLVQSVAGWPGCQYPPCRRALDGPDVRSACAALAQIATAAAGTGSGKLLALGCTPAVRVAQFAQGRGVEFARRTCLCCGINRDFWCASLCWVLVLERKCRPPGSGPLHGSEGEGHLCGV
mmetsp:Transcript_17719/g.42591  ORF Transcript_17719/g.42591 Transcript_17719/m.42591 type:complete len:140 (+) Transcript_17719:426-845(+)